MRDVPSPARLLRRRCLLAFLGALSGATAMSQPTLAGDAAWSALSPDGIVLFRHAEAPGVSDPPGMRLDDCGTQRNLSEVGRTQAATIGARFRTRGIYPAAVLHSQWCRARETAQIAFPGGGIQAEPIFNSFFGDPAARERQTAEARALLRRWRGPGVLVVVTHQVNITALTGHGVAPAEGLIVRPGRGRQGRIEVVGRLSPD